MPASASAQAGTSEIGLRFNIVGATGKPTNDILGTGIYYRRGLNDRWILGFALDHSPEFDVERPYEFLGLVGDPAAGEVDAVGVSTAIKIFIERSYEEPGRKTEWFWSVGAGINFVDIDPLVGPLADGTQYDLTFDVSNETLLSATLGGRYRLNSGWAFEAALRFDQHMADWTVTDQNTGLRTTIDDYLVKGVHLGFGYRF